MKRSIERPLTSILDLTHHIEHRPGRPHPRPLPAACNRLRDCRPGEGSWPPPRWEFGLDNERANEAARDLLRRAGRPHCPTGDSPLRIWAICFKERAAPRAVSR